ncbi:MAG: cytochrome c biogenesis protein CcsA [Opitutaceae bacterium]|nr:cytochrome c biogenesis protein CcsA [Opitutaceae bacterium]
MKEFLGYFRDLFISLRFTIALLAFSILLVFAATLDQTNLGIWGIQQKWFRTFVVFQDVRGVQLPLFPGGYLIGGLLLLNLVAAHIYRFKLAWRKLGIILAHAGLILLLVGELLTGLWQEEYFMRLDHDETKSYAESYLHNELAIIDTTSPDFDSVVAIPDELLRRKTEVQHPDLPFRVVPKVFYPNSVLRSRPPGAENPTLATVGAGLSIMVTPEPVSYKTDAVNVPSVYVEFIGAEGSLGTYLASAALATPQTFEHAGRTWSVSLRAKRLYKPFSLTLLQFTHERYAGTEIPKNFSSRVRLRTEDGREDREVVIFMNNPLRHAGLTFYQAGFANNDRTTVLQVVRNPSWLLPYVACTIISVGLLAQFGVHLLGFARRRRQPAATTARDRNAPASAPASAPAPLSKSARLVPRIAFVFAALLVVASLRSPANRDDFDLVGFGRLPTLVNGRIKPLDTVARTTLLTTQGRQRVTYPDGATVSPETWLLDMLFVPDRADAAQTFEITHPDLLSLLGLSTDVGAAKKRFSLDQMRPRLGELERQANLASDVETPLRTPFQRAALALRNNVALHQRLQASIVPPRVDDFLENAIDFGTTLPAGIAALRARSAGQPHDADLAAKVLAHSQTFVALESFGYLLPIPPLENPDDLTKWSNAGASLQASLLDGRVNPAIPAFARLGLAWRSRDAAAFNAAVAELRAPLSAAIPSRLLKSDVEARFNAAQPFYTSMLLYVVAFLLAVLSWLRWPAALGRAAFALVALAFALSTAGILARMWLESRPPVTNLYSSALFVGWGAVALCLVLESAYKNAIASVAASLVGFSSLLIAHHLSLGGDTLEMMRAVLDSNFWLATHVVTITVGYSATFLAGALAIIYVVRGSLTESLDSATADSLNRMVYGITCFAVFFSFVGTVLGGIWADQSWGRFWGWDPKENGALIIVLWTALILHARWAGLVKARGLMILAIFGNVITAWSWFGVNMLGVGLHSYGFMDSAFWWLIAFVASQAALMLLAALPLRLWRSPLVAS